jgi:hypothetical protein
MLYTRTDRTTAIYMYNVIKYIQGYFAGYHACVCLRTFGKVTVYFDRARPDSVHLSGRDPPGTNVEDNKLQNLRYTVIIRLSVNNACIWKMHYPMSITSTSIIHKCLLKNLCFTVCKRVFHVYWFC